MDPDVSSKSTTARGADAGFPINKLSINEDELMDAQEVLHMPRQLYRYHPPYLRTQQPRPHPISVRY
jgi:hypothetical protein